MDVVMPVLDGIEATRQIVLNQPQVRVVGLSVHDSPVYVARMLEAGASAYLLKDCDLETLIRVLQCPDRALAGVNDKAVGPASAQSAKRAAVYQFR